MSERRKLPAPVAEGVREVLGAIGLVPVLGETEEQRAARKAKRASYDERLARVEAENRAREELERRRAEERERKTKRAKLDAWGAADVPVERFDEVVLGRKLAAMGVPAKDIPAIVGCELRDTEPLVRVREAGWALLVISGGVGCGKTTAAAWWLSQGAQRPYLLDDLRPPLYLRAPQLERVSRYDEERMVGIERAEKLVIDDLGTEYLDGKGALSKLLETVIDARYAAELPTLITTNLTLSEIAGDGEAPGLYGERIADRIRDKNGAFWSTDAPSMRGK
jgi:hypothetical protein